MGAAVPLRGCVGRRVRPVRRLVVRGVMGGVVWVGGGGHRCRAWGPVMGSLVAVAGGGIRGGVCQRGYRRRLAGAGCRVLCPWPGLGGGGAGGGGVGVALLVVGGAGVGVVLAGGLGVPVGRVGVACVRRPTGPTPTHAVGAPHRGGAAATFCPLLASLPWQRGAYLVLRSLVVVVEAVALVWLWRWLTRLVKLGVRPCWSADGTR